MQQMLKPSVMFYSRMASIPLLNSSNSLLSTFVMSYSAFVFGHCWRNLADAVIVKRP